MTRHLPKPVRLHARSAVVDLSAELMREVTKLFGREPEVLEVEG